MSRLYPNCTWSWPAYSYFIVSLLSLILILFVTIRVYDNFATHGGGGRVVVAMGEVSAETTRCDEIDALFFFLLRIVFSLTRI